MYAKIFTELSRNVLLIFPFQHAVCEGEKVRHPVHVQSATSADGTPRV